MNKQKEKKSVMEKMLVLHLIGREDTKVQGKHVYTNVGSIITAGR